MESSSESVSQQLLYRGYWFDAKLGWYWLGMRSYDPEGRFLQPDPTGLDGTFTYLYTGDDPADFTDIMGLFDCPSQPISLNPTPLGPQPTIDLVHGLCEALIQVAQGGGTAVAATFNLFIGDDVHTILTNPDWKAKGVALAWLLVTVIPASRLAKLLRFVPFAPALLEKVLALIARAAHRYVPEWVVVYAVDLLQKGRDFIEHLRGCTCFPAGTQVATANGFVGITALHVGQSVLSEDPATGKVEPEAVQAVINDGVKPVLRLTLSDGEAITVTADHPFYVDGGTLLHRTGWLEAGQLWPGDRLRSATDHAVTVTAVRSQVGEAPVYTLTVAKDHTFGVKVPAIMISSWVPRGCWFTTAIAYRRKR